MTSQWRASHIKVHVDHLHPWLDEQAKSNTGTYDVIVNDTPDVEDEPVVSSENDHDVSQPGCSQQDHKITKRLIEELN